MALQQTRKIDLVLFDVGGVIIDLFLDSARQALLNQCRMPVSVYQDITRATFEQQPFSATENATIAKGMCSRHERWVCRVCSTRVTQSFARHCIGWIYYEDNVPGLKPWPILLCPFGANFSYFVTFVSFCKKDVWADRCRAQRKKRGFCHNQIPLAATRGTAMKRVKSAAGGICATGP